MIKSVCEVGSVHYGREYLNEREDTHSYMLNKLLWYINQWHLSHLHYNSLQFQCQSGGGVDFKKYLVEGSILAWPPLLQYQLLLYAQI
jgi:hypothetical protein